MEQGPKDFRTVKSMPSSRTRPLTPMVILILVLLSLPSNVAGEDEDTIRIVCSNSILADFAENVVGDWAQVEYLMPAGVCPSHFDSRPSDAKAVSEADIIVMMGWEGWLNGLIASTNEDVDTIVCMGLGDQNLPEDAKGFVEHIAIEMALLQPEHSTAIVEDAASYQDEIDTKAAELEARVQAEGIVGREVVVMEWQMAFVEWLGFNVTAYYGPPEGLSVQDQLDVTDAASQEEVTMVIDNLQSTTEFGTLVSADTGKSHVVLTNYPSAYPNTYNYLDMIDYNTDKLIEGVKTYDHKRGEIATLEQEVKDLEVQNAAYMSMAVIFLIAAVLMGLVLVRSRSRDG
jgi:ABC-type Zn uptake system ZnuABC Zn-binding protein ZnuA